MEGFSGLMMVTRLCKWCVVLGRNEFAVPKVDPRHVSLPSREVSFWFDSVLGQVDAVWYTPSTLTGKPFGKR